MRPRRDRTPTLALAIGGAFLAHVVVLVVQDAPDRARAPDRAALDQPVAEASPFDLVPTQIALISLDSIDLAALPLVVVPGPGDVAGFDATSPMPNASADLPGDVAADRGGGALGGEVTWTGRRDPDQTALRGQLWSDPDRYRAPRQDRDRRAATTEAIARQPDPTYGDRQVRARAKAGDPSPSRGDRSAGTGAGNGTAAGGADPTLAPAAGKTTPARADGATQRSPEAAMVDEGATATDVERHGKVSDDVSVAAASDQRDPDPYDLTPSRSGGTDEGVRGKKTGDGALADGRGHGTGASRSRAAVGKAASAIMAERTDPYLRDLLRKLDDEIVFPHDLKLDLRSGRVIVTMLVAADGKPSDLTVTLTSGYDGFDRELVRALKALGKLGKVPARLLDGKRSLKLMVPYTFKNPMIR